jgi:hypothetical protein
MISIKYQINNIAFSAEAAPFCWNTGASPAASADIATPTPAGTHCHVNLND